MYNNYYNIVTIKNVLYHYIKFENKYKIKILIINIKYQ